MKKLFGLLLLTILLVACGGEDVSPAKGTSEPVKVGIRSSEVTTWNYIKERAAEQGIDIELVILSAQLDPNQLLAEGELDLNAFQHVAYLNLFNTSNNTNIEPIGTTIIAPIGLYSNKYDKIEDLKEGMKVAVPNDPSNWGRALLLLQEKGFIKVSEDFDGNGGADRIKENPYNLEILPVEAATLPRVMEDIDFAIINNGIALESGLYLTDALIHEDAAAKPFINVIATNAEDVDNETYQKIVDIYQDEETSAFIEKEFESNFLPVKLTLEELATWKDVYSY
ncbi:MAG: MetQ/NlpA family ABC transporter substrate-binding protein [Solibacillus sp.]